MTKHSSHLEVGAIRRLDRGSQEVGHHVDFGKGPGRLGEASVLVDLLAPPRGPHETQEGDPDPHGAPEEPHLSALLVFLRGGAPTGLVEGVRAVPEDAEGYEEEEASAHEIHSRRGLADVGLKV